MSLPDTAMLLEDAAERIGDVALPDLQILLRRAALRLRNSSAVSFEDDIDDALRDLAGELGMTRNDTVRFIVREWLEKNAYLPVHMVGGGGDA
ncbi:CopG family transcriptional regulator [Rhizobium leguminosarum]|uniref:CopG family transcriptional regulator n=1 Tax=Rhizobium leguminosarum TaxID=384 RepID=UPI001038654E|nr:CopG family transcriptional regulator [Rhizobium leguminosarum]TCA53733.1 CopG family transcriptional regulator [Rhizobium leguminosarum bv. viciae]TCB17477.1 CopG family transcriptional regulator [Rhizobium leguminosarum bv. viciae]